MSRHKEIVMETKTKLSKKKKIVIAIIVCLFGALVIASSIFGIVVAVREKYPSSLSNEQREILLKRGEQTDFTPLNVPLIREINQDNPLNMITYYGDAQGVSELWQEIPDDIKKISVLLLIKGNILAPGNSPQSLIEVADECDRLQIPYAVQFINGETHFEWIVPIAWIEEEFCDRPYFYGMSTAELYNGEEWRGQLDGDMAWYINDGIRLMAKHGLYMFITDTNKFGTYGTFSDWIEENEYLYTTMQECSQHIIMQNKESYGDPSSYSLMKGLYLAGLIGGWGVSTDWWHWQVSNFKVLFKEGKNNIDNEWERIYYYPEIMQTMSMAMVAANGGFCFKNEAEFYSVALGGRRTATFQWCTIPFLRSLANDIIDIPSKEEVLQNEKMAVVGAKNYEPVNYYLDESTLYPNSPKYHIIPLLPENLRQKEISIFDANDIKLINTKLSKDILQTYAYTYATGNTYMSKIGNQWLFLNNCENINLEKSATALELNHKDTQITIKSYPHGYVFFNEYNDKLTFSINNYRIDKYDMISALDGSEDPKDALYEWIGVDKATNSIKAEDSTLRTTEITLKVSQQPEIVWHEVSDNLKDHVKDFKFESSYKDGVFTLKIHHNGYVGFDIKLPYSDIDKSSIQKQDITNNIISENTSSDYKKIEETIEKYKHIYDNAALYSETAFAAYRKSYSILLQALQEKNISDKEISSAIEFLNDTPLLDTQKYYALLNQTMQNGITSQNSAAFDRLLREVLSPTKYYNYKDKSLTTYLWTRKKYYDNNLYNIKIKALDKQYNNLMSLSKA